MLLNARSALIAELARDATRAGASRGARAATAAALAVSDALLATAAWPCEALDVVSPITWNAFLSRSFGSIDRVGRWAVWRVLASLLP